MPRQSIDTSGEAGKRKTRVFLKADEGRFPVELLLLMKSNAHVRVIGPAFRLNGREVEPGTVLVVPKSRLVWR